MELKNDDFQPYNSSNVPNIICGLVSDLYSCKVMLFVMWE